MGVWADIKYALNSTLGTDEFTPLNELVIPEKTLMASDTVYKAVVPWGSSVSISANTETDICTINANRSGTIRLTVTQSSGGMPTISVYENDDITPTATAGARTLDVTIVKNNTYRVTFKTTGSSVISSFVVGANELDASGIIPVV